MKNIISKLNIFFLFGIMIFFTGCAQEYGSDELSNQAGLMHSFSVHGKDNAFFRATINDDQTVTIKVSPYLDAQEMLDSAIPTFYLTKGATVSPDPNLPQNFAQQGGVKYTVTAQNGSTQQDYIVSWGVSDHLAEGEGFSYAEIGASKNFVELGYPGEFQNFGLADPKLYGDLMVTPAYCGENIVLLSRSYVEENPGSAYSIKVVNKTTLQDAGSLNLTGIAAMDLKVISSDYRGHLVGLVVKNGSTEVFYWKKTNEAPTSIGQIAINMAASADGSANFQVAGDITSNAWITALAPRNANGDHYRIKVTEARLASNYTTISTGYSSTDCTGFQMISPLDDGDQPNFIIGDSEGAAGTANSVKAYVQTFSGSTTHVMPGMWQNILQTWWVGTGVTTSRYGGRTPYVSGMVINGKSYALVTSGTAWWHAAAVLSADLGTLTHENLNIAESVNRSWSYGSVADWYYDPQTKEAFIALWLGRFGLKTYKLTCFE